MRIGTVLSYSGGFAETIAELADYEKAGLDIVFVPEAYSFDAVSQLGFIAATHRADADRVGHPADLHPDPDADGDDRGGPGLRLWRPVQLGIGASGPQVIEGFHGVPYDAPLGRTRELVEICRQVWRRERLEYHGKHYQIPLPADRGTGLGKPLKLINRPVRERIPIIIAAIGPKNVAMAAEIAEGWQPIFYLPGASRRSMGRFAGGGAGQARPVAGRS